LDPVQKKHVYNKWVCGYNLLEPTDSTRSMRKVELKYKCKLELNDPCMDMEQWLFNEKTGYNKMNECIK
jgi:hypothetical protein